MFFRRSKSSKQKIRAPYISEREIVAALNGLTVDMINRPGVWHQLDHGIEVMAERSEPPVTFINFLIPLGLNFSMDAIMMHQHPSGYWDHERFLEKHEVVMGKKVFRGYLLEAPEQICFGLVGELAFENQACKSA